MALEAAGANAILDAWLEGATYYVGLLTALDAEPSGSGYARVAVNAATWAAAATASKANGAVVTFPEASGSWGELTQVGLYTAATSGTLLCKYDLTTPVTVTSPQVPRFPIGDFVFTAA